MTPTPKEPTMPNNEELIALAERVEAASGPDRELDDAIATEIFRFAGMSQLLGVPEEQQFRTFAYSNGSIGSSLRYTASLDAAMTLVPEAGTFEVCRRVPGEGAYADVDITFRAGAATPALALTAAALRARAAA